VTDLDVTALAETLADTIRDLQAHIGQRAWEIAEPQILKVQDECAAKVAELERELAAADQRFNDLRREIARHHKVRDREFAELKDLRELRKRVIQQLTVKATGPGGERWADYDALTAAVFPKAETEAS